MKTVLSIITSDVHLLRVVGGGGGVRGGCTGGEGGGDEGE